MKILEACHGLELLACTLLARPVLPFELLQKTGHLNLKHMKLPNIKIASAMASLLLPMGASAAYIEVGDAGQTLATAQAVPGGTSVITGSLTTGTADLFSFNWGGGAFYVNSVGTSWDSQLFLFNSTGAGVQGNDDGISFAGPAYLQLGALAAGTYYLGISVFNLDPYSASGIIFQSSPFAGLYGPNNSDPLSSWAGSSGSGGAYTINFQRVTSDGTPIGDPNPVGVPDGGTTLALLSMSLGGIAWARRKMK